MQPDLLLTPFGSSATAGTIDPIPVNPGSGDPPQKASWSKGFPGATMTPLAAGGAPPRGQDFNGVFKAISEHTAFLCAGGAYQWNAAVVSAVGGYAKGAVVQSNDGLSSYVSTIDNNTIDFNTTPGSIGNQWLVWTGSAKANASVTISAGAGLTGGGNLTANRTLAVSFGTTAGTVAQGNDTRIIGAAQKSANLSDLASVATARTNLGLAAGATAPFGTTAGTIAQGNDSRIVGAAQTGANLSDLASVATARANLGLGTSATANVTVGQNDSTPGRVTMTGDYGWGGSAPSSTNVDTITTGGTYSVGNADAGTLPVSGMIGTLFHMERNSSGLRAQILISNLGAVYTRSAASSVWRAWSEILRGMPGLYKSGFSMSNNSANPAGKVDVSIGFAKDTGNSIDINLPTPITGILVGPWTSGNDQNKLDSGTRTANTWYHLYAVRRTSDGQGDIVFSTSPTSPASNPGYSGIRRIGSVKTDAANNIIPFFNAGNFFCWKLPIRDAQVVGAGTSPSATITTSTPSGVPTLGQFEVAGYANGTFVHLRSTGSDAISIPALTNNAGWLAGLGTATESTVESVSQETNVLTNSSSQIVFQGSSATSMTYSVTTKGWWEL